MKKVLNTPIESINIPSAVGACKNTNVPSEIACENINIPPEVDDINSLKPEDIIGVPVNIAATIIKRALEVYNNKKVRTSFYSDLTYEVPKDNSKMPMQVSVSKLGTIKCNKRECLDFSIFSICAHSLAAAAFTGYIKKFIERLVKVPSQNKMLNLANFGNPSGVGSKSGYKRSRKRKSAVIDSQLEIATPSKQRLLKPANPTPANITKPAKIGKSSRAILSPMIMGVSKDIEKLVKLHEPPTVAIGTYYPKPPMPEPQLQAYQLLKRKGKVAVCNGCGDRFNDDAYILGRNEIEWYIKVNRIDSTKKFQCSTRNFYYCLKEVCLRKRRPCMDINELKIICQQDVPEETKNNASTIFATTIDRIDH